MKNQTSWKKKKNQTHWKLQAPYLLGKIPASLLDLTNAGVGSVHLFTRKLMLKTDYRADLTHCVIWWLDPVPEKPH